jgi:hypothetical protein
MVMLKLVLAGAALVAPLLVLLPAGESPASVRADVAGTACDGCAPGTRDAVYAAAETELTAARQKGGAPTAANAQLDEVRAKLAKAKNGLMREGKYSCCIAPSCDFCAIALNGCVCGDNLAKGKPVCGECKGGWTAGYGMNPDIDPKDVKVLSDAEMKQMYKSRAELMKKSPGDRKE